MQRRFLFTRVGYVYIPTTDIDASIRWYTEHLQLHLIEKFMDRGSHIAVLHHPHKNAVALLLVETDVHEPLAINRNGRPFPVMALNCPDIEHTYNELKAAGVEIVQELTPLGEGDARYFYFRDNQGNLLEGAWSVWDPEDDINQCFVMDERA